MAGGCTGDQLSLIAGPEVESGLNIMTVVTLKITEEDKQAARATAAALGLTIGRGPLASEGSIKQLVEAIAAGDLVVKNKRPELCEKCRAAVFP